MSSSGALAARLTADTTQFRAEMGAAANVSEKEMRRIQKQVQFVNDYIREMAKVQREAGSSSAGLEQTAKSMEHVGFASSGAKRELLVLAHELSQGNYSRFGGSLLVLAERTNAMELAFSAAGLAIGGTALVIGGFLVAAVAGAIEQERFNKSLIATGNFAGQTADSLNALAIAAARSTDSTIRAAKGAAEELTKTGRFGPDTIGIATQATLNMERVTGQSADEIAKDFAKMGDGVAKWAAEHNRSMHYLSLEQFKYIKQLEDQGKAEAAERENLRLISLQTKQAAENVGLLAAAWHLAKDAFSGFIDGAMNIGKALTDTQRLAALRVQLAQVENTRPGSSAFGGDSQHLLDKRKESIRAEIDAVRERMRLASQAANAQAQEGARAQKGIDAIMNPPKTAGTDFYGEVLSGITKYRVQTEELGAAVKAEGAVEVWATEQRAKLQKETAHLTASQRVASEAAINAAAHERVARLRELEDRAKLVKSIQSEIDQQDRNQSARDALTTSGNATLRSYQMQTEAIGKTADELERLTAVQKVEADLAAALAKNPDAATTKGLYEQAAKQRADVEAAVAERQRKQREFDANPMNGVNKAVRDYSKNVANQAKFAEDYVNGSLSRLEDAFVQFAKTGKLSFSDLFNFMAEEFIRNQIRMAMSSSLGGGGFLGSLAGLFGGGGGASAAATGTDLALQGLPFIPLASGMSYVPYDGFRATLHEGERVLTKQQNRTSSASGQSPNVHITQYIDGTTDQARLGMIAATAAKQAVMAYAETQRAQGR